LYAELMTAFPYMRAQFPFDGVRELCEKTAANTSSMLADRLAGRKTEVDTIVGAIIKKAAVNGRKLPTLHTLYELMKATEQLESGDKV
jgi:2-dehydropantoate 2-reductase